MNYTIDLEPHLSDAAVLLLRKPRVSLTFLPENLNEVSQPEDFIYPESTIDLRKFFKKENLSIDYLTKHKPTLRSRKSADWFGPTLFIGASILTENSALVNVSLNLLSSFLYDFFKGVRSDQQVKFEVICGSETTKGFKKITYEGNVEGIKELPQVIEQLMK